MGDFCLKNGMEIDKTLLFLAIYFYPSTPIFPAFGEGAIDMDSNDSHIRDKFISQAPNLG